MSNEKITRMARIMKSRQGRNKKQDENNEENKIMKEELSVFIGKAEKKQVVGFKL